MNILRALLVVATFVLAGAIFAQAPNAEPMRSMFDRLSPEAKTHYESVAIRLWDDRAPDAGGDAAADTPVLYPVLAAQASPHPLPAILVFAGGSYNYHSAAEAFPIAEMFRDAGFAAFVLKYRLNPYSRAVSLADAQRAVRVLRARSAELNIDPAHVAVIGFSAGGHLAANLSTRGDDGDPAAADPVARLSSRIQSAILFYPGILHTRVDRTTPAGRELATLVALEGLHRFVDARTPPTFMIVGYDDTSVPYEHCLVYAARLHEAGVRFELHVLGEGGHGAEVRERRKSVWKPLALQWLTTCGFPSAR